MNRGSNKAIGTCQTETMKNNNENKKLEAAL